MTVAQLANSITRIMTPREDLAGGVRRKCVSRMPHSKRGLLQEGPTPLAAARLALQALGTAKGTRRSPIRKPQALSRASGVYVESSRRLRFDGSADDAASHKRSVPELMLKLPPSSYAIRSWPSMRGTMANARSSSGVVFKAPFRVVRRIGRVFTSLEFRSRPRARCSASCIALTRPRL